MKKIAFMFVAAAMFVACGEKKAQEAEVEVVEENVETIDTAAVLAAIGDTTGLNLDSAAFAERFAFVADSLKAAAADTTAAADSAVVAE